MKRIISLLLCVALMIGGFALAEASAGGSGYSLSGLSFNAEGQTTDLSDITICVDIADGEPGALLLHVQSGGEMIAAIGFTQLDDLYIMHMESPTLGHKDYAIDPVKELAHSLDSLRDQLVALLEGVDTTAAAQSIYDFFDHMDEEVEAPAPTEEPAEEQEPEIGFDGDVASVLRDIDQARETVELQGTTIDFNGNETAVPDGKYVHSSFTVDREHFLQVIDMVTINGAHTDAFAQLQEAGTDIELRGDFHIGKDVDAGFGSVTLALADDETDVLAGLGFLRAPSDAGDTITIVIGQSENGKITSATLAVAKREGMDVAFGPDEVDAENLILLSDMEEAERTELLAQDLGILAGDALGALIGPLTESIPAAAE